MNDRCPTCGEPVVLAAVENQRNGKWTVLPLEQVEGDFTLYDMTHEAVDIMGRVVGEFPVAAQVPGDYQTHHPSHYLEQGH
jgi:hypothetical protein